MLVRLRKSLYRSEGASAVEYAVLIAAISALIVATVFILGRRVKSAFSATNSCISVKGATEACGAPDDDGNDRGGPRR